MGITFFKLNGTHPSLNYENLESSFKRRFGRTCTDASIYVLNSFPVMVTPETDIDLIVIIAVENRKGNYIMFKKEDSPVYLYNLIIPIKYVNDYQDSHAEFIHGTILIDDNEIDYSKEINGLTYNLKRYLNNHCGFSDEAYIHPLIFIKNNSNLNSEECLVRPELNFDGIADWLANNKQRFLSSVKSWASETGFLNVDKDVNRLLEQASKDSITGFLTKRKIERISKELSQANRLYESLSQKMIVIKGKAGSGKTSNLITLNIKALQTGFNTYYLTYNRVLVYDISQLIKPIANTKGVGKQASVDTLHSFFFQLSKSLGVLHVMTDVRIKEVLNTLRDRLGVVYRHILPMIQNEVEIDFRTIKESIQNNVSLDNAEREVGIDFVNYLSKRKIKSQKAFKSASTDFYKQKENRLSSMETDKVFLADYYGVLKNTLLQIQDSDKFFDDFNIREKGDLMDLATGSQKSYSNDDGTINKEEFKKFNNRRVGGRKRKRIVFIDEAQDCHRLEKEILAAIYGTNKLVIASGGKEQLIRHKELCNWEMLKGQKIDLDSLNKKSKSYRIKPKIADFCNYYGTEYGIEMDLESLDTEDQGELIFDFRSNLSSDNTTELFGNFKRKGAINGCLEYESVLTLLQSLGNNSEGSVGSSNVYINEYSNIEDSINYSHGEWKHKRKLEQSGFQFFDATVVDKSKIGMPYPNEIRLIYYESCRGLEAWTVACFDLDRFFEEKQEDDDAEKFLLEDEKGSNVQSLFVTNEQRKKMYAATWVIMALTRAIDTLYIKVKNKDSEFSKVLNKYLESAGENVKVIR